MKMLASRWFLSLMVVPLLLLKFFWVELAERTAENFHGASASQQGDVGLALREMASVTGYKLVPARNNVDQVHAQHVHVVGRKGQSRTLAFTLASTAPDNDYPSLRVTLSHPDGSKPRIVEFGPADYGHAKELSSETIELTLEIREGELRAVVEPFYGPGDA